MAKILIIDDSNLARRMLRNILEPEGHEILEAADGLSGLERFSLEKPDLVFLDLSMPGLSGLEVLEKLRRMDTGARVLIATADVQNFTRKIASTSGAAGYLIKPLEPGPVLDAVNAALKEGADR